MGTSEYMNSRRGGWMHRETKYLGICVSSSWVFFCLKEPLRGLKYCKIWSSRGIPSSQGVKHPEQNRSYIISAPQSAPWGICKKHKHSYKCTENARHTEASAELLAWTVGRGCILPGYAVMCRLFILQRVQPSPGGKELSPLQMAGTKGQGCSSLSLLPPAPRGAIGQMAEWGHTVALQHPSPREWIWASMQTQCPTLFYWRWWRILAFLQKANFFSMEMIDVFKLTLLPCYNVGKNVPLPY